MSRLFLLFALLLLVALVYRSIRKQKNRINPVKKTDSR